MRYLVIGILVILGVGMTLAQGLTRKEQAALSGVVSDLNRVERNLGVIMDSSDPAIRQKRLSSEGPKIEKILKETKAELDVLPASNADVATQIVRHGKLGTRFLEVTKEVSGGTQTAAAGQAGWESYAASPQLKVDQSFVRSTSQLLTNAASLYGQIGNLDLMGNPNNIPMRERLLSIAKDTPRLDKALQDLVAKYTAFGSRESQRELNSVNAARTELAGIVNAQTDFKAKAPNAQATYAANFDKELAGRVAAKDFNGISDLWSVVGKNRAAVAFLADVYKALEPSRAAAMEAVVVKLEANYKTTMQKVATDVMNSNKPPVDAYTGADATNVRNTALTEWKKLFGTKYQVIGARIINSTWSRQTGLNWDTFESAWVEFDYSEIDLAIIIKWDNKYAAVFRATLIKQHMKGDAIVFRHFFNPTPNPTQLVLLSKF
ncbi:MAG: hypothetical protein RLZZ156_2009 [Deinococcota bacterium]|jgi:hypothetical protein